MALQEFRSNKLRTFLSLLGITFGIFCIISVLSTIGSMEVAIQKDIKEEFTDPLKDLSRTQGKVLVKMIERHLDTPMYNVLRDVRGSFTATKWQTIGRLYGYDLKEGYTPGKDRILDMILNDFELNVE